MKSTSLALLMISLLAVTGCVAGSTYRESVGKIETLEKEKAALTDELQAAEAGKAKLQEALDAANATIDEGRRTQHNVEVKLAEVKGELDLLQRASEEMRNERDMLQSTVDDLEDRSKDLATEIETQQSLVAKLQNDKQRLMSGSTTAQAEIAKIQKRAGELEVLAARVPDLEERLSERKEEIARIRKRTDEVEREAAQAQKRVRELSVAAARVQDLQQRLAQRDNEIGQLQRIAADREAEVAALTQQRDQLTSELDHQGRLLEVGEEEKARLEQERAAKEAEIQRLTQTHADLRNSLENEISKGNIRIQQVRDRLRINMVDRVLFDSGQGHVKPAGLKVLDEMGTVLTNVTDKQIRIEGHTDNVPIGKKLRGRFPTNWELSSARATSVVRHLTEKGLVDPANISAIGYADTRPVASNKTNRGRKANRRIEIVLYPKDVSTIVNEVSPTQR